jgi:tRNA pseudouridine55 synthase
VGHTGTLDPFATGLLPVLTGRGTRLARFLAGMDKTYTGVIHLGQETDSGDSAGVIVEESDGWDSISVGELETAMDRLTGVIMQKPPELSAKKIQGVPAHRLVRRGEKVDLAEVEVTVNQFVLKAKNGRECEFRAVVSAGTYIRALARDLGRTLGCGAHLTALRRTDVGPFSIEQAVTIENIGPEAVQSVQTAIPHLSVVTVDGAAKTNLLHGRSVPITDSVENPVAMVDSDGLIGIGEVADGVLYPKVVLAE